MSFFIVITPTDFVIETPNSKMSFQISVDVFKLLKFNYLTVSHVLYMNIDCISVVSIVNVNESLMKLQ